MVGSISRGTITGTYTTNSGSTTTKVRDVGVDTLTVSTRGYPIDHPFAKSGYRISGCVTNGVGRGSVANTFYTYVNYPSNTYEKETSTTPLPVPGSNNAALLAATNPTRPVVRLPVLISELRELPMMVREAFAFYFKKPNKYLHLMSPKAIANANLAAQFGWLPLVSDLLKLSDLPNLTHKRAKEFEDLRSKKGLRHRVNLGQAQASPPETSTITGGLYQGNFGVMVAQSSKHSFSWGVARWKPAFRSPYAALGPSPKQLRRMILGMQSYQLASNLWEAVPWSWLIDWFSNFGDALQASEGRTICVPSGGVICTTTIHTDTWPAKTVNSIGFPNPPLTLSFSGGSKVRHVYQRTLLTNTLADAFLPDLSGRQLSILASLKIQRIR